MIKRYFYFFMINIKCKKNPINVFLGINLGNDIEVWLRWWGHYCIKVKVGKIVFGHRGVESK
jgi:hypothetical protein